MRLDPDKTCVVYCRVSSTDQIEGTSLEMQERLCREYAQRQGWTVAEVFIERGVSAKSADRVELNRAIVFCKAKKIDCFLVYKLDRFARNQDDHVTVRALLRRSGTELQSVTEPIDDSPIGRAMEGILSVFAELDNNIRAERTKQGMQERVRQGVWVWQAPIGYRRLQPGANISPDPETAPLIRLIFQEYAKGIYTLDALADHVAARGLLSALGRRPRRQLIHRILLNPVYGGIMRVYGSEFPGVFEPIVPAALYAKCEALYRRPRSQLRLYVADNPQFPLRRLVVCTACGKPLTGSAPQGRNGVRYPYYHHAQHTCALDRSIPTRDLEKLFVEHLHAITPRPRFLKLFRASVLSAWKEQRDNQHQHRLVFTRELAALEQERQQVFDFHRRGVYDDEEFRDQLAKVARQIKQKSLLLEEKVPAQADVEVLLDYCVSYIQKVPETWRRLESDPATRLRLQNRIFGGHVQFDGERFRNTHLSLVYQLNEEDQSGNIQVVPFIRQNLKQVLAELAGWGELPQPEERSAPIRD